MDTTFIYFLKDPENPNKGYVGKTDNPITRLPRHIIECRTKKHHRANWIRSLATRGLKPSLEVIDEVPFKHWKQLEVAYIEFFLKQGYVLTNGTPGGEDPPSRKGKTLSLEQRAKIGRPSPNRGKNLPLETCKKISAALTGKKLAPEHIARRLGKKQKPETINKRIAKTRGKKRKYSTSHFIGISLHNGGPKWLARLNCEGRSIHVGLFKDEIAAAKAYDTAAKIQFGASAKLNFPND